MKKVIAFLGASLLVTACGRSPVQPTPAPANPVSVAATYAVSGTVSEPTDDGARRVVGASVVIGNDSQSLTATTDENGAFSVEGLIAGPWQLSVSKEGYEPQTMMLDITSSQTLELELKAAASYRGSRAHR